MEQKKYDFISWIKVYLWLCLFVYKQYFIIHGLYLLKMKDNTKSSFMELDLYFFL